MSEQLTLPHYHSPILAVVIAIAITCAYCCALSALDKACNVCTQLTNCIVYLIQLFPACFHWLVNCYTCNVDTTSILHNPQDLLGVKLQSLEVRPDSVHPVLGTGHLPSTINQSADQHHGNENNNSLPEKAFPTHSPPVYTWKSPSKISW